MGFTDAYLEKGMTGFHEYASAASRSVRNMRSLQTLHDVAKSDSCVRPEMRLQCTDGPE